MWRAPDEEYHKDTVGTTHISGFRKIKFWSVIQYGKKSKRVIINEKKGEGKMNSEDYIREIMDEELFDFWLEGMEETGQLLVMEDGAGYHQKAATLRRQQLKVNGQIEQGPETQPSNSSDLNSIENV